MFSADLEINNLRWDEARPLCKIDISDWRFSGASVDASSLPALPDRQR